MHRLQNTQQLNTAHPMDNNCVDRGLDSVCLMVNVKDEDEEAVSVARHPHWSSFTFIKKENYEEAGRSCDSHPDAHTIKDSPDSPSGVNRTCKKRKRRKREEGDWPSSVVEAEGSGVDALWRCRLCQHCFSSSWELTGHCCMGIMGSEGGKVGTAPESSSSKGIEFCCPVCGDRFLRPTAFIMHKRSHVGQSHYVCGVCGRTLRTLQKLAAHRRLHTRAAVCRREGTSVAAHQKGQKHESVNSDGKGEETKEPDSSGDAVPSCAHLAAQVLQSPECLQCFMTFRDAETAERHLRFKHPAKYEQQIRGHTLFACSVCDQTFPSSRLLSAHQRTHSEWSLTTAGSEDPSQDCTPDSNVNLMADRHQVEECRKNGSISMSCIYCHITFTDPRTWERHMTAKHPAAPSSLAAPGTPPSSCSPPARASGGQQRPYCCLTCGERFIQESSLAKHCDEAHMQTDTTGDTDIG